MTDKSNEICNKCRNGWIPFKGTFRKCMYSKKYIKGKGSETMNSTKCTIFRLKQSEQEQLKKDAHAHEMTVSEYLRWLIRKERKEYEKNG